MENSSEQRIRDLQHFGEEGGVVPVIDHAATSTFLNPKDMGKVFDGDLEGCYLYSRHQNPTVSMFAAKIAAFEGTQAAIATASGMSAIACTIEQLRLRRSAETRSHVICSDTVYGGTYALFANILPRHGIEVSFVDINNREQVSQAYREGETFVIYTESLSNPLLNVSDLQKLSEFAKQKEISFVVDNTFTPLLVAPKKWGADVVIHSCTKFISGASDMVGGVICCDQDLANELIDLNTGMAMLYGPVMDPQVAYKLYVRLDHLVLRMKAHSECANYLVQKIEEAGLSERVTYPGLKKHKQYKTMTQLLQSTEFGYGAMVTFDCGSREKAIQFAQVLQEEKFGLFAVSLGFSRTLMSCPAASTSSEVPEEKRQEIGLKEGLIRFSVGFVGDKEEMSQRFLRSYKKVFKSE